MIVRWQGSTSGSTDDRTMAGEHLWERETALQEESSYQRDPLLGEARRVLEGRDGAEGHSELSHREEKSVKRHEEVQEQRSKAGRSGPGGGQMQRAMRGQAQSELHKAQVQEEFIESQGVEECSRAQNEGEGKTQNERCEARSEVPSKSVKRHGKAANEEEEEQEEEHDRPSEPERSGKGGGKVGRDAVLTDMKRPLKSLSTGTKSRTNSSQSKVLTPQAPGDKSQDKTGHSKMPTEQAPEHGLKTTQGNDDKENECSDACLDPHAWAYVTVDVGSVSLLPPRIEDDSPRRTRDDSEGCASSTCAPVSPLAEIGMLHLKEYNGTAQSQGSGDTGAHVFDVQPSRRSGTLEARAAATARYLRDTPSPQKKTRYRRKSTGDASLHLVLAARAKDMMRRKAKPGSGGTQRLEIERLEDEIERLQGHQTGSART